MIDAPEEVVQRATVSRVVSLIWPDEANQKMLDKDYHRRCTDCGAAFKARDLHLYLRADGDGDRVKPLPLCPSCAHKRGDVEPLNMRAKAVEARSRQRDQEVREAMRSAIERMQDRIQPVAPPVIIPGRQPIVQPRPSLLDRIRASQRARARARRRKR